MHIKVKDLPNSIKSALHEISYGRDDIELFVAETISPRCPSGDGSRGVFVAIDIATGARNISYGSWGGSNMFEQKIVDVVDTPFPIPPNCAVIKGSCGNRTFVSLYLNPINAAPLLPASPVELDFDEAKCLYAFKGLKPAYRKGVYKEDALERMILRGFIKRTKVGCQITTDGRNAWSDWCKANHWSEFSAPRKDREI